MGADVTGRDGDLADELAVKVEERSAVMVLEADLVWVVDGQAEAEGEVEFEGEEGDVEGQKSDGVYCGGGVLGLEEGEGEDDNEEDKEADEGQADGAAARRGSAAARLRGQRGRGRLDIHRQ